MESLEGTSYRSKFVVTFLENIPRQAQNGIVSARRDLKSVHEEDDINIVKQCISCLNDGSICIKIICDDTDVFVLLTVYVFRQANQSKVLTEAFDSSRSLIDINETAKKHAEIVPSHIAAHALSGCDSVPKLYGIGKKTIIKHLKQNLSLTRLGDTGFP